MKAGDVVQLKSSGPFMTVARVFENSIGIETATVFWFVPPISALLVDSQSLCNAEIPVAALRVDER